MPVFVPAFVDSEIGNDIYIHNMKRRQRGKKPILMDLERDSEELIKLVTAPNASVSLPSAAACRATTYRMSRR